MSKNAEAARPRSKPFSTGATFLRNGVRQRYGNRAEKLVEFDLAPLRPKAKASDTAKPPVTPVTHPTTA